MKIHYRATQFLPVSAATAIWLFLSAAFFANTIAQSAVSTTNAAPATSTNAVTSAANPVKLTAPANANTNLTTLRRVAQVRDLSALEAAKGYPVQVTGTLTYFDPPHYHQFFQEGNNGIYLDLRGRKFEARAGQKVEIRGFSGPGDFAPIIVVDQIQVLGDGTTPNAQLKDYRTLMTGTSDCQWVAAHGIIRSQTVENDKTVMQLSTGGGVVKVTFPQAAVSPAPQDFTDASVELRGVCSTVFNDQRQLRGVQMFIPSWDQIKVREAAGEHPESLPFKPVTQLLQFHPDSEGLHRVRIRGVVTLQRTDHILFVQDETSGIRVQAKNPVSEFDAGKVVEITGFPGLIDGIPELQEGVVKASSESVKIKPIALVPEQSLNEAFHANLVQVQGRMLESSMRGTERIITLQFGQTLVDAVKTGEATRWDTLDLVPGCTIRVEGVYVASFNDARKIRAFRVMLRSPADVLVVERPPWWTLERALVVVGFLGGASLLTLLWIALLRRRVGQQTQHIREQLERETELEKKYREIFENANDCIYMRDLDGNFTSLNPAGLRMLGYTPADIPKLNTRQVVAPEYQETIKKVVAQILADGKSAAFEVELVARDGRRIFVEANCRRVEQDGKVIGVGGIARDISERKRVEGILREKEEFIRNVIDTDPNFIFVKDRQGRFTLVNRANADFIGLPIEQVTGKLESELNPNRTEVAKFLADDLEVMKNKQEKYIAEELVTSPSGKSVWLQTVKRPLLSPDGTANHVVGVATDITRRKQEEEVRKRAEAFLQSVVQNLPIIVFIKEAKELRTILYNRTAEEFFGYTTAEVMGKSDFDMYPREEAEKFMASDRETLKTGRLVDIPEERIDTRAHQGRILHTRKYPIYNELGEPTHLLGIAEDITERKQREEELKHARIAAEAANKAKSEFLANMSHEIRTPMNGVIGMTNLLLETNLDEEQRDFAETAKNSAESLLTIINDILDFSKIEAGKLHFENLDFDLRDVVESVLDLLSEKASRKGIEIGALVAHDVHGYLRGDAGRLRQVLVNLVTNAVKFTEKGEVFLSVSLEKDSGQEALVRFEVSDTGIGIDAEAQSRLFRPFTQADGSTTRKFGGTGLGLAISKQIVELMHGEIGVRSQLSKGSTFWFTARFEKRPHVPGPLDTVNERLNGKRVLVVDDNEVNRRILTHHLAAWGMETHATSDAHRALEQLERGVAEGRPFQLAIVDMQMPVMDGFQLARAIQQAPQLRRLRVIMLTSLGQQHSAAALRAAGIDACLVKPVKRLILCRTLLDIVPLVEAPLLAQATERAETKTVAQPVKSLRVLLAEDNAVNQKLAIAQILKLGYRADAVGNGLEVLSAIRTIPYDVILMDCQMPEMDGYETTRRLRAAGNSIYIIAMTANAMQGDRERCLQAGMNDYVSKPVRIDYLETALNKALAQRQANAVPRS